MVRYVPDKPQSVGILHSECIPYQPWLTKHSMVFMMQARAGDDGEKGAFLPNGVGLLEDHQPNGPSDGPGTISQW